MVNSSAAAVSAGLLSKLPDSSFCSVFDLGPCFPQFLPPMGQDLRADHCFDRRTGFTREVCLTLGTVYRVDGLKTGGGGGGGAGGGGATNFCISARVSAAPMRAIKVGHETRCNGLRPNLANSISVSPVCCAGLHLQRRYRKMSLPRPPALTGPLLGVRPAR